MHRRVIDPQDRVLRWEDLTSTDFARLGEERVVVTVSCSPLEVHGPHLPVKADYFEAEGLTTRAIEILAEREPGMRFLRLPPLYVATDVVPRRGSIQFRTRTIVETLSDLGRSLARQGFRDIWVASFHGSPRHFLAIETAAERVNRRYGARMISLFSLLAARLTRGTSDVKELLSHIEGLSPEVLEGDSHAGVVETSILLHLFPGGVDPMYRDLERRTVDTVRRAQGRAPAAHDASKVSILERIRSLLAVLKYFEEETYAGHPAVASPEIGERLLQFFGEHVAEAGAELWRGELALRDCHSPLWPYRHLITSPLIQSAVERLLGFRNRVF